MTLYPKLEMFYKSIFDRLLDPFDKFGDSSTITRFIKDKKHKKSCNGVLTATPDAFLYPDGVQAISLAHIDNLSEHAIWKLGDKRVFAKTKQSVKFRADMNVGKLKEQNFPHFSIVRDNAEFWRHVTATSSLEKHLWANQLSLLSNLVQRE